MWVREDGATSSQEDSTWIMDVLARSQFSLNK